MKIQKVLSVILFINIAALAAGCTTTGTGTGDLNYQNTDDRPTTVVKFTWKKGEDEQQNMMTATLADDIYKGTFFQSSDQSRVEATLSDAQGNRMHCRFFLNLPIMGLSSGGQGECQLSDDRTINVVLNAL